MKWLLDTNVICEPGKRRPNIKVVAVIHGLTLATRDTGDIAPGVRVFNPFA